jgi:hypothetical protein
MVWLVDPAIGFVRVVLVEIKPDSFLQEEASSYLDRLKAARRFCHRNGWTFRLFTDRRIRSTEIPEVVWPSFFVPPVALLSAAQVLPRLFSHARSTA